LIGYFIHRDFLGSVYPLVIKNSKLQL